MNDEPIPPTDSGAPPVLPPVMPPPVVTPPPPPRPLTPAWVFTLLKTVLVVGLIALLVVIVNFSLQIPWLEERMDHLKNYLEDHFWEGVWKVTLIGTCGLFAVLSILVIVGGALDVRKLFNRLREREASGDSDSTD
jgi:hypothetical protein